MKSTAFVVLVLYSLYQVTWQSRWCHLSCLFVMLIQLTKFEVTNNFKIWNTKSASHFGSGLQVATRSRDNRNDIPIYLKILEGTGMMHLEIRHQVFVFLSVNSTVVTWFILVLSEVHASDNSQQINYKQPNHVFLLL